MIESGLSIQKGTMLKAIPFCIDQRHVNRKKQSRVRSPRNLMGAAKRLLSSLRERELLHFLVIWLLGWIALGIITIMV